LKASNSDLIVPMLQRGNAAPDAPRPYPQPAPSAPDRSHAPAWEPSPGRSASVSHRCGVFTSAFRPDGESGEMHGHFPRHPPRPPQLHGPSGSLRCSVCRGCAQTRRFAPQTPRTSSSRQPCATRPRRRGLGFRASATYAALAREGRVPTRPWCCTLVSRSSRSSTLPGCPCTNTVLISPSRQTTPFCFYLSRVTACPLPRPPLL